MQTLFKGFMFKDIRIEINATNNLTLSKNCVNLHVQTTPETMLSATEQVALHVKRKCTSCLS